jgi:hypothetical protein
MPRRTVISRVLRSVSEVHNYKELFDFTQKTFDFSDFYNINLEEFNTRFEELFPEDNFQFVKFFIPDDTEFSFFKKSLFIFALKLSYYIKHTMPSYNISQTPPSIINYDDGKLKSSSRNCMTTVFSYNENNKFLKLVPIDSNSDCIIFDIINGIIFNIILRYSNRYRKHLASYEYSFLSYYNPISVHDYWLYEALIDFENITSPYNTSCLSINNEYKKAYVVISEAITHIGLGKLFSSADPNNTEDINNTYILSILEIGFIYFFSFLIDLKTRYGFEHNDLHGGNIIYDVDNNSLILIDFGRSVFGKYTIDDFDDNHNRDLLELNKSLQCEIEKLDLKINGHYSSLFRLNSINDYKDLISKCISDNNQSYVRIIKGSDNSIIFSSGLFELLSLCLLFYILFMLYFSKSTNPSIIEAVAELKNYFDHIIFKKTHSGFNFMIRAASITQLYTNYTVIKKNYINGRLKERAHSFTSYRNTLDLLLDGLFILALLLFINGIKINKSENLFTCIIYANGSWNFRDLAHKKRLINTFIVKLAENENELYTLLEKHNFFVFKFIKSELLFESSGGGGKLKNKKGGVSIMSSKPSEETQIIEPLKKETEKEKEISQISIDNVNESYTRLLSQRVTYREELEKLNECYNITYSNIEKEKEKKIKIELQKKEIYKKQPNITVYTNTPEELKELEELEELKELEKLEELEESEELNELSIIMNEYIDSLSLSSETKNGGFNKKKYIRKLKRY